VGASARKSKVCALILGRGELGGKSVREL